MATYYSDHVILNAAGANTIPAKYHEVGAFVTYAEVTLPSGTTLATNDTLQLCDIAPGIVVTGVTVDTDKLDTNATPTIVYSVGVTGTTAQFVSLSTTAQAGGFQIQNVAGALGVIGGGNTTPTRVFATITTGAATGIAAAKKFRFMIEQTATA